MASVPIQFFLHLSKLINLHNTTLIMTNEEQIPLQFCSGAYFPITCQHYDATDSNEIADQLQSETVECNPIFISEGNHINLMTKLKENQLLFTWSRVWIIPMFYSNVVPLRLDNNIIFYEKTGYRGYNIHEKYNSGNIVRSETASSVFLEWSKGQGNYERLKMPINALDRRSNMHQAIIKYSYSRTKAKNGKILIKEGIHNDVLSALQARLNFTVKHEVPEKWNYGKQVKNGTWNGVIGEVMRGKIDLLGSLMISHARREAVDFSWINIDEDKITLLSSKSSIPKLDVLAYLTVFSGIAWATSFAFLVMLAIFFSLSNNESFTQGMTLMGRLFLQIGYEVTTKRYASKTLLIVSALYLNMVFIYYCSDLTATMTSEPLPLNVKSFEDAESQGYKVIVRGGDGRMHQLLKTAHPGSAMRRIYDDKKYIEIDSRGKMVDVASKDPKTLAWHAAKMADDYDNIIALDIREARTMEKTLAFRKGSELTTLFNHVILKMKEGGLINRMKNKWKTARDTVFGMAEPIELKFDNLFFPFACLALGILVTIPITMTEIVVSRFQWHVQCEQ